MALAAGIARRRAAGLRTWLHAEEPDGSALRYLQRIDFFRELGVERTENFQRHPAEDRFVPLRRIQDLRIARSLADDTGRFLEARIPTLPSSLQRAARFVFDELGANIVQHSERSDTGFGLAQAFSESGRIQIAFADAGVGFFRSLQKNLELAGRIEDDAQAIPLALEKPITRGGQGNLGIGLSFLRDLADRLGGDLWIASGTALFHRWGPSPAERNQSIESTSGWQGAWLCLDAPMPGS